VASEHPQNRAKRAWLVCDHSMAATFAPDTLAPLRLDVDDNNAYDALTDGLLVSRYLYVSRRSLRVSAEELGVS